MQQFTIIKKGYRSKKQRDIKFYYLADFANYTLGFRLCKVDKFAPKDRGHRFNFARIAGDSCDWLNLASKIGFNLDLAKHLYKHRAQANSVT